MTISLYTLHTLDGTEITYPIPSLEALTQVPYEMLAPAEKMGELPFHKQREAWSEYLSLWDKDAGTQWRMLSDAAWIDAMQQAHTCEETELALAYLLEES